MTYDLQFSFEFDNFRKNMPTLHAERTSRGKLFYSPTMLLLFYSPTMLQKITIKHICLYYHFFEKDLFFVTLRNCHFCIRNSTYVPLGLGFRVRV